MGINEEVTNKCGDDERPPQGSMEHSKDIEWKSSQCASWGRVTRGRQKERMVTENAPGWREQKYHVLLREFTKDVHWIWQHKGHCDVSKLPCQWSDNSRLPTVLQISGLHSSITSYHFHTQTPGSSHAELPAWTDATASCSCANPWPGALSNSQTPVVLPD